MLENPIVMNILLVFYFVVGIAITLIVSLQPPRGEGLGAIGGSASIFKGKNPIRKLLDRIVISLGVLFVALTILLVVITI